MSIVGKLLGLPTEEEKEQQFKIAEEKRRLLEKLPDDRLIMLALYHAWSGGENAYHSVANDLIRKELANRISCPQLLFF